MSAELKKLEQAAGQLPTKERARLIRRLISTLQRDGEGDVEQTWLGEAERRLSFCRRYEDWNDYLTCAPRVGDDFVEVMVRRKEPSLEPYEPLD